MKKFSLAFASVAAVALTTPAFAAPLATVVTASDSNYSGDLSTLNDGFIPPKFQWYSQNSVYNFSPDTIFRFDFGGVKTVTGVLAAFDNNDDYFVRLYKDSTLVHTFTVWADDGPVQAWQGGFDLFSSDALPGYTQIDSPFSVEADYALVFGANGDVLYGIGEVQFFGRQGAVPEPASWALMIGGFGLAGSALRRSRRKVQFA